MTTALPIPPPPPPMDEPVFARRCDECPDAVVLECQRRFGKHWRAKSSGGEGCAHPIDAAERFLPAR